MALDTSIKSVLVIGSGPIVIGQACEFDYSGTQACRVLRAEGIRVILVNSNPATIMTDPEFADATYIEPITPEIIEEIRSIMWSGCSFWVVLNRKGGSIQELQSFNYSIIQTNMCNFTASINGGKLLICWGLYCESMVVGCYLHLSSALVDHRLIDSTMSSK